MQLSNQVENWSTPSAHDGRRPGADLCSTQGRNLNREASTWSTPRASDGEKGGPNMSFGAGGTPLPTQAAHWPTPEAAQFGTSDVQRLLDRRAKYQKKHGNNGFGLTLWQAVKLWPTPAASEPRQGYQRRPEGMASRQGQQSLTTCAVDFLPPRQARLTRFGGTSPTPALSCYLRFRATTDSVLHSEMRALLLMGIRSRGRKLKVDGLARPLFTGWTRARPDPFVRPSFRRRLNPTFVEWLTRMPFGLSGFEREATELTRWLERMRGCLSTLHSAAIEPPQGRLL